MRISLIWILKGRIRFTCLAFFVFKEFNYFERESVRRTEVEVRWINNFIDGRLEQKRFIREWNGEVARDKL